MTQNRMNTIVLSTLLLICGAEMAQTHFYKIVDTGQTTFFNNSSDITAPSSNQAFYGQDAQFPGHQPSYTDNGDGTITDNATGLMWQQQDSPSALNWQDALAWVQQKNKENYLGHNDWRLPNVKELHSIVDYSRSPATTNSAAIDPVFSCSDITDEGGDKNYPCYWSGTTHQNMQSGSNAAYVAFGEGLGWMTGPMGGNYTLTDVHGASCQRSDPKSGDPNDYPYGHGPQGDVIRIYNYVRLVRNADSSTDTGDATGALQNDFQLRQNYPNPFNPSTTISFLLPTAGTISLKIYNTLGQLVTTLVDEQLAQGHHSFHWQAGHLTCGRYFYSLQGRSTFETKSMVLLR